MAADPVGAAVTRRRELAALAAILALGGGLRFGALDRQGLLFFDEGQLILEARQAQDLSARWWKSATASPEHRAAARLDLADAVRDCRIVFGKPGHNLALAGALVVEPDARRATLALSALAGTLTVAALWIAARRWFGAPTALGAALLLAVSPYHLLYARAGLSDALTVLGLVAALAVPAGRGLAAAAVSGIFAGCAVTTNYRNLFLPAIFAWLVWLDTADGGVARLRRFAGRLTVWVAGFVLPLAACELLYHLIGAAAGTGPVFPGGTYVGQLRELLAYHGGQGFRWAGWPAFPAHLLRWEGPVALLALVAALCWQLRRWRGADAGVNVLLLAPWVLFSAYWDNAPRFFAILLPVVAAIQARWLREGGRWLAARRSWPGWTAAGPVIAVALAALPRAAAQIPRTTPYHEAARLIASAGDPRHLSTNPRLGTAYFGPGTAAPVPPSESDLAVTARAGWRWVVIDLQMYFGGFDRPAERVVVAESLVARRTPVLDVAYSPAIIAQFVLEQDLTYRDALDMLARVEAMSPRLRVYDLSAPR